MRRFCEVLLVLEVLIGAYHDLETSGFSGGEQFAVPQPGPAQLWTH